MAKPLSCHAYVSTVLLYIPKGCFLHTLSNIKPGFYDISGNRVIDLSEYDIKTGSYMEDLGALVPYFENGKATIRFANNAGSIFQVDIDQTGAFLGEPEKVGESLI